MSFDLDKLREAVAARGRVARVVVAEAKGSAPREAGAAMLVWDGGQDGTIGGGALEWEALARARAMLTEGGSGPVSPFPRRGGEAPEAGGAAPAGPGEMRDPDACAPTDSPSSRADGNAPRIGATARVDRLALGPELQQCCGGAVVLLTEVWDAARLAALDTRAGLAARSLAEGTEIPLSVARRLAAARGEGRTAGPILIDGWAVELLTVPVRQVWVWGAGHVGRAVVAVLAPLPGLAITWVDTARDRFPEAAPEGVETVVAADPARLAAHAPAGAEHLILTYSHALDLALCHALLRRGFARCGLIGSATKRARFRKRLAELGHAPAEVARIDCPIGDPVLGKHPQAIAISVAAAILRETRALRSGKDCAG
jgi:xanthine dehydrogenase accessory factor